ncbi:MAG: gamma-glutamyl-gamma-aminobutyrate hydrolase family protein [Firmicutes bacterium]|nr:gamma-glutamyl-gamma-aminobutyrate hydrolase family protein [Bacillota bacterium]
MLPVGITCGIVEEERCLRLSWDYVKAVERAGGFPVPLMLFKTGSVRRALEMIRGLILSGGGDVDPYHFGEEPFPGCGEISPWRDEMELELARAAIEAEMPILGICRGAQVLNIALGGDIFQDIKLKGGQLLEHMQKAPAYYPYHSLKIKEGTKLGSIFSGKAELRVNSFHHQAIRKPGENLIISAVAADGVIEAVESTRHPFALGVQWHPEAMAGKNNPGGQELFDALLEAATRYR